MASLKGLLIILKLLPYWLVGFEIVRTPVPDGLEGPAAFDTPMLLVEPWVLRTIFEASLKLIALPVLAWGDMRENSVVFIAVVVNPNWIGASLAPLIFLPPVTMVESFYPEGLITL